ncbi:MAG: hypothetical protein K0U98_07225 [Deltaproteobacteria bacterium]|nr:hypothetical protein [Deltaproteobacteria bacterium]
MKGRGKRVILAVLALLGLPLLVILLLAVSFQLENRSNGSIVSSGEVRKYLLHVPKSYDATQPTPLVISFHGGAGWPVLQRDLTGWNDTAENQGFIVVYPAGLDAGGMTGWRVTRPGAGLTKDVQFISDLIDQLEKTYNVDRTRVYANGLSNGGSMAFVLSCNLPDRIAAVGMVAAAHVLPWGWCSDRRPVPMISFHGTADPLAPYEGGISWVGPASFRDPVQWAASWARRNGCGPDTTKSLIVVGVTRQDYTECTDDAAVAFLTIHGGGHTWPGAEPLPEWILGSTNRSISATREMWTFFQKHRLAVEP